MHPNIWYTLYLTLVPSAITFAIAIVLHLYKAKYARPVFVTAAGFLLFPIIFIVGHFASVGSALKKRAGTYVVRHQDKMQALCPGEKFDSLQLVLDKNGRFVFNYKPCFSDRISGKWKWTDDMVHAYSSFDQVNDSLELDFLSESNVDTIVLTNDHSRYLTFSRSK